MKSGHFLGTFELRFSSLKVTTRGLTSLTITTAMLLSACSTQTPSTTFSAATLPALDTGSAYKDFFALPDAERSAAFSALGSLNFADYFSFLQAHTSNAAALVDGREVSGALDALLSQRSSILSLQDKFPNIAALWSHYGVDPDAVSFASYQAGVEQLLATPRAALSLTALPSGTCNRASIPATLGTQAVNGARLMASSRSSLPTSQAGSRRIATQPLLATGPTSACSGPSCPLPAANQQWIPAQKGGAWTLQTNLGKDPTRIYNDDVKQVYTPNGGTLYPAMRGTMPEPIETPDYLDFGQTQWACLEGEAGD